MRTCEEKWRRKVLQQRECKLASFPGLPRCVQYNTRKWKSAKNGEGLVSFITCLTSGGREVDVGGGGAQPQICLTIATSWGDNPSDFELWATEVNHIS